jgi:hypothetical protein
VYADKLGLLIFVALLHPGQQKDERKRSSFYFNTIDNCQWTISNYGIALRYVSNACELLVFVALLHLGNEILKPKRAGVQKHSGS